MEKYSAWIIRHKWSVISFTFLAFLILSAGLINLKISTDFRVYLGDNTRDVANLEKMEAEFTKNETLFIALIPGDGKVFKPTVVEAIQNLTDQAWKTPHSRRVDSISNFQYSRADGDDIIVGDLIPEKYSYTPAFLNAAREAAIQEPMLKNFLISADASATAIQITLHLSDDLRERMQQTPESVEFVRNLIAEVAPQYPDIDIHLAGSVLMNQVMGEAALNDMLYLVPICYVVITLLMFALLRNVWGVSITLGIVSIANGIVIGMTGWLDHILAPVAGFVPNAILVIAVADCIHILTTYYTEIANGARKEEAIKHSLKINFSAIAITSLTTIIGFLCLNFNESPPYRELGNMVAVGTLIAFLLSITFLPAVLAALPASRVKHKPLLSQLMPALGSVVIRHYRWCLTSMAVLSVGMIYALTQNSLNDNWNEYFDETFDLRIASETVNEHITGLHRIDYAIAMGEEEAIAEPEYLAFIERFSHWMSQQNGVRYLSSIDSTFRRLNKNMNGDSEDSYHIPESRVLAAQYLLFYEMSLPFGLDLSNQVSFDKSSSRLTVILDKTTSEHVLDLQAKAEQWLTANRPDFIEVSDATGLDIAFANIARSNTRSMLWGTVVAFFLISVTLAFVTRSFAYGAISLIPNMLPAICAFGVWGLTVSQIGLATSAVVCMAIGIIVDDTVHFLTKYRYACRALGKSAREAVQYAFSTVGVAMAITTIILVAGFIVMGFSPFQPTSQMGALLSLTIATALLIDLILLPALLIFIDDLKPEKIADTDEFSTVKD